MTIATEFSKVPFRAGKRWKTTSKGSPEISTSLISIKKYIFFEVGGQLFFPHLLAEILGMFVAKLYTVWVSLTDNNVNLISTCLGMSGRQQCATCTWTFF